MSCFARDIFLNNDYTVRQEFYIKPQLSFINGITLLHEENDSNATKSNVKSIFFALLHKYVCCEVTFII